jgi:hypothetical protein
MTKTKTVQNPETKNPKHQGPKPEFDQEKMPFPGWTDEMNPKPDHGEESYRGSGRLRDKVALITGGDSGIGRAVAIAFAREGANLAFTYLPEEEKDACATFEWVKKADREAFRRAGDICDEQYCNDFIDKTFEYFGRLDLLVNIAGFQSTHDRLEEFTTEEIDRTWKTNVYALIWLCRAALPRMTEGGAIINTASIQAFDPSPNLLPYAASKSAIVSITKTLSHIGMKKGVRTNAVAPGPVWTPLIPSTMPEKKVKEFGKNTDFGRPAQPVEIAPVYVFLASNESRYVTGEVYGITGGRMPY